MIKKILLFMSAFFMFTCANAMQDELSRSAQRAVDQLHEDDQDPISEMALHVTGDLTSTFLVNSLRLPDGSGEKVANMQNLLERVDDTDRVLILAIIKKRRNTFTQKDVERRLIQFETGINSRNIVIARRAQTSIKREIEQAGNSLSEIQHFFDLLSPAGQKTLLAIDPDFSLKEEHAELNEITGRFENLEKKFSALQNAANPPAPLEEVGAENSAEVAEEEPLSPQQDEENEDAEND